MQSSIPYEQWRSLSVEEVRTIFENAPFDWCLAGGYAIEQFVGKSFRSHDDIDIVVYRDEQIKIQRWLQDWQLYAADPPGTLRTWTIDEYLPYGIHDIWGHRAGADAWQLQVMLSETEGDAWFSRRSPLIRGSRHDLIAQFNGIPCIRPEVQLMYKAKNPRPKDDFDFMACLPLLSADAKRWLADALKTLYPEGHKWLHLLS